MERAQHVRLGLAGGFLGAAVGAQAIGLTWIGDILLAPVMVAGYAEYPDIDQKGSHIYRSFPPLTIPAHWVVVWLHRIFYFLTYRRGTDPPLIDRKRRKKKTWVSRILPGTKIEFIGAHRGLAHGLTFAIVMGTLIGYFCMTSPWFVSAAVIVASAGLAGELVFAGPVLLAYCIAGALKYGGAEFLQHLPEMGWLWGIAATFGMIMHLFGDQCTKSGVAWLSPWLWTRLVLPISFVTGKSFEKKIVKWILVGLCVYTGYLLLESLGGL